MHWIVAIHLHARSRGALAFCAWSREAVEAIVESGDHVPFSSSSGLALAGSAPAPVAVVG